LETTTTVQQGMDLQTLFYILVIACVYIAIVYFRVKGIPKKILLAVLGRIEIKAKTNNEQVQKIMEQLKFEIMQEVDNKDMLDDMNNVLSVIDPKHKKNKFVRVLKTIFKIATFLK